MRKKFRSVPCSLPSSSFCNGCLVNNDRLFLFLDSRDSTYRKCVVCEFRHPIKDLVEIEPGIFGPRYVCKQCIKKHNHTLIGSANGLPSIGVDLVVNAANGVNSPGVEREDARGSSAGNVSGVTTSDYQDLKTNPQLMNWIGEVEVLGAKKMHHHLLAPMHLIDCNLKISPNPLKTRLF